MSGRTVLVESFLQIIDDLIEHQQGVLLSLGRRFVPSVTLDDLMQPNDFPVLESNPLFRYEEGVLHGYQAMKAAINFQIHNKY